MLSWRILILGAVVPLVLLGQQEGCPVTKQPSPAFVPAGVQMRPADGFFLGTSKLSVMNGGSWVGLPKWETGYRNKVVWWSEGYDWKADPRPAIEITGRRLDGAAPGLVVTGANGSYRDDMGSFIMSGVNVPVRGCWEITGKFKGSAVSFVVWVE